MGEDEAAGAASDPDRTIAELPSAEDRVEEIVAQARGRPLAVFLDYDGTLTPIVDDPEDATLPPEARATIERLRGRCPVAVVSGRDLDDVRGMVAIDDLAYAGSHGFDILTASGERYRHAREYLGDLDAAQEQVQPLLDPIPGAELERKTFAIAVHYRNVEESDSERVQAAVEEVAAAHPRLRLTAGKRIFELRPDVDWDKGRALRSVLDSLDLAESAFPLYVGDDVTDEDAFRELEQRGIGIVVRGEDDDRPTRADYSLPDPAAACGFLDRLADALAREADDDA
ncbi:MAG TPA: trehalose-phosphatase [Nitriliruptorales bacterium]|nr:trehalose-phosphatase [Nitriliruptorales bacterium]